MDLHFIDLDEAHPLLDDVERIFHAGFPHRTDLSMAEFLRLKESGGFDFRAVLDGEELVGFYNAIVSPAMVYLFFFGIDPPHRSKGYGSRVLSLLEDIYPGRVQLLDMETVDPAADNYEQRCRRQSFYVKNGYRDSGYRISYYGGDYTLMTRSDFSLTELERLLNTVELPGFYPRITKA